jgi:small-conductance mechanosensitive channel
MSDDLGVDLDFQCGVCDFCAGDEDDGEGGQALCAVVQDRMEIASWKARAEAAESRANANMASRDHALGLLTAAEAQRDEARAETKAMHLALDDHDRDLDEARAQVAVEKGLVASLRANIKQGTDNALNALEERDIQIASLRTQVAALREALEKEACWTGGNCGTTLCSRCAALSPPAAPERGECQRSETCAKPDGHSGSCINNVGAPL